MVLYMDTTKLPTAVKNLLKKIEKGESHRVSHDTYQFVKDRDLARFSSAFEGGSGKWELTETGREAIRPFVPQEVAYFLPGSGKGWRKKTVRTAAALAKLLEKLADEGAETQTRDAEGA